MPSSDQIATSPLLRRLNATAVVRAMRATGPMTASDLMAATGLSRPSVHGVCDHLIRLGLVVERETRRPDGGSRLGRPARVYEFNDRAGYALGIDLGAHKVTVGLTDLRGTPVAETTREFEHHLVPASVRLPVVNAAVDTTLAEAAVDAAEVHAVGMGVPGPVDAAGHVVASEDYLPDLAGQDLKAAVRRGLGWPVLVENDANLAVLGERWKGVAVDVADVVVVLAGERLGSGIHLDGRLVRGSAGSAGELDLLALVEGVGNTDAIGLLATRWGAEAVAAPGAAGALAELAGGNPDAVHAAMVFDAARAGDPAAAEVVDRIVERMARVLGVLSTLLNPELIVIGGAVAGSADVLLEPLQRRLPALTKSPPRLAAAALGDRAVVVGALRLALDHIEAHLFDPKEITP